MKKLLPMIAAVFGVAIAYQAYNMVAEAQKPVIIVGPVICIEELGGSCDFEEIPGIAEAEHYDDFKEWHG